MTRGNRFHVRVTRRQAVQFVGGGCLASAALLLAACSQSPAAPASGGTAAPAAQPTAAPAAQATTAPAAPATAAPAPAASVAPALTGPTPVPTAGAITRGGTLKVDLQNDFVTMFPPVNTGPIPVCCFDWLVNWRKGANGTWGATPGLAESWDLAGNTATFKLRQGVKFHDGSDLNAAAVKWNIDTMVKDPKSTAKVTLEAVDPANPSTVVDDYTIKVNLKYPDGSLLAALSDAQSTSGITSKAAYDKLGADGIAKHAVGTGPFQFVSWQPGNQTVVKRNPNYWQKGADGKALPYLDQIIYKYIVQDTVRTLDMQSGNADFTEAIAPADIAKVKTIPTLAFVTAEWFSNKFRMVFNSKQEPFGSNLKLRQALLYSLNRDAIAQALGFGIASASKYDWIQGELGYSNSVPYYDYQPAKAKQLMQEAGFANGVSTKLTLISRELDQQQGQMIQQMAGAVGIHLTLEPMERTAWVKKVRVNNSFTVATQQTNYPPDPDLEIPLEWASTGPAAYSRAKIPEMDKLLIEGRQSYDSAARQKTYEQIQKLMFDTAWWGFLWHRPWNYVLNTRVQGFDPGWGIRREEVLWIKQ